MGPHPDCANPPEDCRISVVNSAATAQSWTPIYDGNGMLVNSDPNMLVTELHCTTCERTWYETNQGGIIERSDTRPDLPQPPDMMPTEGGV